MKECNPPSYLNMTRLGLKPFAKTFDRLYDFPRAEMFFRLLVMCALGGQSMEAVCSREFEASDRLFHYMASRTLEESSLYCNVLLKMTWSLLAKTRRQWKRLYLAIDHNDVEYHGKDPLMVHDAMRLKNIQYQHVRVLRYATLCLVGPKFKFTLAVLPVSVRDRPEDTVEKLLTFMPKDLKVKVKGVLMDKEFYNSRVMKTVEGMGFEYLVPGKKYKEMALTYRVCETTDKWRWKYTMNRGKENEYMTTVYLKENGLDDYMCMASNKDMSILDDEVLFQAYRSRWNIENSYKETMNYRVRTNSRNTAYRVLIYTISHLLVNLHVLTIIFNKTRITGDDMKLVVRLLFTMKIGETLRMSKKLVIKA